LIDERLKVVLNSPSGHSLQREDLQPKRDCGETNPGQGRLSSLNAMMIEHINRALAMSGGRINGPGGAAEILQIHPNTLRKRMLKLGICKSQRIKNPQK